MIEKPVAPFLKFRQGFGNRFDGRFVQVFLDVIEASYQRLAELFDEISARHTSVVY